MPVKLASASTRLHQIKRGTGKKMIQVGCDREESEESDEQRRKGRAERRGILKF